MHDTAFQIGALAMDIYADLANASVLEIGSQSFNGTLRTKALPSTRYVGIDIEEGEGVDVVVQPSQPFPVEEGSFDLVIASSVFEHDPCFWLTFLQMCRAAKDGGFIYINAPSNGVVHNYPEDDWRFYPGAGKALANWAVSQGHHITLMESFVAEREADIWNDFVAVFRKGRITKLQPATSLHEHVPSVNVVTWRREGMLRPRDEPQDLVLLAQASKKATEAEQEAGQIRETLSLRESELIQRQEQIQQTRDELGRTKSALSGSEADAERLRTRLAKVSADLSGTIQAAERAEARAMSLTETLDDCRKTDERLRLEIVQLENDLRNQQAEAHSFKTRYDDDVPALTNMLHQAELRAEAAEGERAERFRELSILTGLLREHEARIAELSDHARWSEEVRACLAGQPAWWSLMPAAWRKEKVRRRLRNARLFDDRAYLDRYPDVAAEGFDALEHYSRHGINERRSRYS